MSRPVREVARWLAVAVVLSFVTLCLVWRLDGGRWERVETPSMGTVAPVGTLLWVRPADFDTLRPGDFITFRPPGSSGETYSHRVLARDPDGRISTQGVLSAPDPWRLTADDVVGKVEMRWWGVGHLVRAAPLLLLGGLLTVGAYVAVARRWKVPVALVLGCAVLSAAIAWYRPLVDAQQLSFAPSAGGGADASYVGTGLLPIRLTAHDGPSVVMHAGEVGQVHVDRVDAGGKLRVTLAPAVPWWWWLALVVPCFVPAVAASRPRPRGGHVAAHDGVVLAPSV
ncbi:MAG TPA: S26 family signal peptidase [Marmoricola sp.]